MTNDEIHKRTNSYRITDAGFYWFPKKGYSKKGIFPSMKKSDKHTVTPNGANAENIDDLKSQMLEMQMENDILKEIINVLKKTPASIRQLSRTERRQ